MYVNRIKVQLNKCSMNGHAERFTKLQHHVVTYIKIAVTIHIKICSQLFLILKRHGY